MAQVIRLKRGASTNLGSLTLAAGEPAFTTDTNKLYIGDGTGTGKILINPDITNATTATTATKLATSRTLALGGDATGSASFDGSANATINATLAASGVTAGTYTKITVDAKGRATSGSVLTAADIPTLTISKVSDAGTAAQKNTGVAAGNVPVLDGNGKLDTSILPALAISDTFPVANQTAMLALAAEVGDIAVRTDQNKTYILKTAGPSTLANWQELLTPTAAVSSVSGKTGAVTLTSADVGLDNVANESKATMFSSPAFTGVPTAPTAAAGTNTTQIASTAFVTAAVTAKTTITGNAATATKLQTARTINGTAFDGTANITITIDTVDGGTF